MEKFKVDFIIKNGHVIDPAQGINAVKTLAVKERRMVDIPQGSGIDARWEFDAKDCLVVPGLIDFHSHYYYHGTTSSINPEIAFLAEGVTTAVDQGSAGLANICNFLDTIAGLTVKTKVFLNVSAPGQPFGGYMPEPFVPEKWERSRFRDVLEYGGDRIVGLKMRTSKSVVLETGARAFYESVKLAGDLGRNLVVHIVDPPMTQSDLANAMRQGDVMCHIYHGRGHTIYENGKIAPAILKARERGVIMDVAHGGQNISLNVAARAIADGFPPDVISADQSSLDWLVPDNYNLPYVMSQFLAFGMKIEDIIRCTTATPAKLLGMEGKVGTLAPGAFADITVLQIKNIPTVFQNSFRETFKGEQLLIPQATFANGLLVYKPIDSAVKRDSEEFGHSI
ncbi:MAG: amidohydrolase family protein [Spirochaetales bacterium]|jgi:predicted amidohydrolase|nr:amidohydrolase family protein [Spirochaetales bacterium]